jgi:hypothetical protein
VHRLWRAGHSALTDYPSYGTCDSYCGSWATMRILPSQLRCGVAVGMFTSALGECQCQRLGVIRIRCLLCWLQGSTFGIGVVLTGLSQWHTTSWCIVPSISTSCGVEPVAVQSTPLVVLIAMRSAPPKHLLLLLLGGCSAPMHLAGREVLQARLGHPLKGECGDRRL